MQAGEALGVGGDLARLDVLDVDDPLGQRDRGVDRVGQPLAQVGPHDQAVDHHRDVVLELLVEDDLLLEAPQLAVDLDPREALGPQLGEELAVLALAPPDHGREHHEARALLPQHHLVHDLLGRLRGDRAAAVVAVGVADPGPEQAQVVVDLGDRAHRRARVARGGLLVDGDRRREALDRVHVGLVHLPQELAGVGRQRLDVAALALGVDGVEGERGLARPGQAGDHHQAVPRQAEMQVSEVVLAGPRDHDLVSPAALLGLHITESTDSPGANVCSQASTLSAPGTARYSTLECSPMYSPSASSGTMAPLSTSTRAQPTEGRLAMRG